MTRKGAWRLEYRAIGRARHGTMNRAGSRAERLKGTEELCRAWRQRLRRTWRQVLRQGHRERRTLVRRLKGQAYWQNTTGLTGLFRHWEG